MSTDQNKVIARRIVDESLDQAQPQHPRRDAACSRASRVLRTAAPLASPALDSLRSIGLCVMSRSADRTPAVQPTEVRLVLVKTCESRLAVATVRPVPGARSPI